MPPISLGIGLSLSMQGGGGGRFGAHSPAGYLLGNEPSGFAVDFVAMDCLARSGPSPYSGDPNGKLTYTAPSTKWITNRHGLLASGTTLRCDHDASTLDTSASSDNSLGVGNGALVRKTLTTSGAVTYVAGQDIVASDASDITKWMAGRVVSYAGGSLVVDFRAASGYFTCSSWKIIVALGLLVEEQRTNLLLNSASLATQNVTVTAAAHTLSFTGTGTVTLSGVSSAGPLVGTGANNRVSLTFTPTSGSLTLTVSGSVTLAQLEVGSFRTSYIPTTSAQVTRAADNISLANSLYPFNFNEGTLVVEAAIEGENVNDNRLAVIGNAASSYRSIDLSRSSNDSILLSTVINNSQTGVGETGNKNTLGQILRTAGVYKENDFAVCLDGGTLSTDLTGSVPTTTVDNLMIGRFPTNIRYLNGHIKSLVYLPRRASNSELQAMTA